MISILVFFSISLIAIQSQTVDRYNVPGDLVSISGDGFIIVIVNTNNSGNRLSILRKTGYTYQQIKVKNSGNVYIPSTQNKNMLKFAHQKIFKPQLSHDGSYMYYISSITGRVVVGYIHGTTSDNPYIYEDYLYNHACETITYSCRFTLHSKQWMSFLNMKQKKVTILQNGHPIHYPMFNIDYRYYPCYFVDSQFVQPLQIRFYPQLYMFAMNMKLNDKYCSINFRILEYSIDLYSRFLQSCNYAGLLILFCNTSTSIIGISEYPTYKNNGDFLYQQQFKTVNYNNEITFRRNDQSYLGFILAKSENLYGISAYTKGFYHLYLHQFSSNPKYQLKITDPNQIKSFDLNSDGTTVVYLNSGNELVVIQNQLGVEQDMSYCKNIAYYYKNYEECYGINTIIWVSFALIILLLTLLFILFIYFYRKYKNLKQNQELQIKDKGRNYYNSKEDQIQQNQNRKQKMQVSGEVLVNGQREKNLQSTA